MDNVKVKSELSSPATKRSSMLFYSHPTDHYSHRVRIVLAEKGLAVDILNIEACELPADLCDLNPYSSLPTLIDRDLVLYQPNVIMEYLDERFPHPPLMPVYPVARAQTRLWMYRVERDWCQHIDILLQQKASATVMQSSRKILRDSLLAVSPIFLEKPFFMSDEFSLIDCCVAPVLWRLPLLGIDLNEKNARGLWQYGKRLFERDALQLSLSDAEREQNHWLF